VTEASDPAAVADGLSGASEEATLKAAGSGGSGGSPPGLTRQPVKEFGLRSAFALSFADLSPIVGIYTVFAIGLAAAGPAFLWAFPLVLIGQLFVCGVFGNLASRWPFQGSVYAWSRELVGRRFGWFTGWAYMWGLTLAIAVLALAASPYLLGALGDGTPSQVTTELVALGILAFGTAVNLVGGSVLKGLIYIALAAELVASLGIGLGLLIFHQVNPVSVIVSGGGTAHGAHWLVSAFLLPVAYIAYSFIGWEASASIGEEVKDARKVVPKAVMLALTSCGALVIFASVGLVLAIPDMPAVLAGKDTNPIATTLEHSFGSAAGRVLLVALVIGFASSMIAVQTAVSRAIWAGARDRALPGAGILGQLSGRENLPRYAIAVPFVISGVLVFFGTTKVFALLVSFASFGFILSYYMPVIGLAWRKLRASPARARGGQESLGASDDGRAWGERWIGMVTAVSVVWLTAEIVNLVWPRAVFGDWYLNWGILIMTGALGVVGGLICWRVFRPGSPASAAPLEPALAAELPSEPGAAVEGGQ
jgi:amino acid transporter